MKLTLRPDLIKGKDKSKPDVPSNQSNTPGEARGGKYAARIQIGYEKDGSPHYKYFESFEARDKYLDKEKGKDKDDKDGDKKDSLKEKTKKEQKESKEKQDSGKKKQKLLVSDRSDPMKESKKEKEPVQEYKGDKTKYKGEKEKVKKSIPSSTPIFIYMFED